jgi:hypothetical protein
MGRVLATSRGPLNQFSKHLQSVLVQENMIGTTANRYEWINLRVPNNPDLNQLFHFFHLHS